MPFSRIVSLSTPSRRRVKGDDIGGRLARAGSTAAGYRHGFPTSQPTEKMQDARGTQTESRITPNFGKMIILRKPSLTNTGSDRNSRCMERRLGECNTSPILVVFGTFTGERVCKFTTKTINGGGLRKQSIARELSQKGMCVCIGV